MTTTDFARFHPDKLAKDTIFGGSVDMDWSELSGENADGVEVHTPTITVDVLDEYWPDWRDDFPADDYDDEGDQLDAAREAFEARDAYYEWKDSFFPMMNYGYPINVYFSEQEAVDNLQEIAPCLSLVTVDGQDYLALTGGGMNLAWDICAGFIACGCLPPARFLEDLPAYSSGGKYRSNLRDDVAALVVACIPVAADILRNKADRMAAHVANLINSEG